MAESQHKSHRTEVNASAALQERIDRAALPKDFVLTDFTRLKGCSCKIPQDHLLGLLRAAAQLKPGEGDVGMDCSIVPVRRREALGAAPPMFLVSTTDFFFPSVDTPYLQGEIGAANVLSDMYAMGITDIDNVLMLLAASTDMETEEADAVTRDMMKGFITKCKEANTEVTGGQSVRNPWPLIGGVAMSVVVDSEMIRPDGLLAGDVMVLTKPLGTQVGVALRQWSHRPSPLFTKHIEGHMTADEIDTVYRSCGRSMAHLNRDAAALMKRFGAHAATDITGFGLLGHSRNLSAAAVGPPVKIVIDTLPIFAGAAKAERLLDNKYKLFAGLSAETSGGLLIAFPSRAQADGFIDTMRREHRHPCWIVGQVKSRLPADTQTAEVTAEAAIIEVPEFLP